ncbi:hypothetical protein [Bradyrhizobium sp. WSM1417]|uniref:hypothetical protein n=1 Tax=Bradyrhizobium sp. WSM1417 TaxID=754500 RepID=UPI0004BC6F47|nr:hypothetical protein [Bradyrhizobium sp. WSM1417]
MAKVAPQSAVPASQAKPPQQRNTVTIDMVESMKGALRAVGGSKADDWNEVIADQAIRTIWKSSNPEAAQNQLDGVISAMICISPKDEFEGMLAAQMIGSHNAAMECYRRAMFPEQSFAGRQEALNQANKLSRTYAALLEALNRHRGKGQQKVTVEHVHVHSGGQAIVGNVAGGGGKAIMENQPHASRYAERSQVRSQDQESEREALPIAGNA